MFGIQTGTLLVCTISVVLAICHSCPKLKEYFTLPVTTQWREEGQAALRVLYQTWLPACWLAILGAGLVATNLAADSVYTGCEDPLVRSLTISYLKITTTYQWCFVTAVVSLQVDCEMTLCEMRTHVWWS